MPLISIIAAVAENRAIGIHNRLPWHLPADLKYFRNKTLGHHVIMGRKNYQSIGKPLPQRTNIVVSRDPGFDAPGCVVVNSIDAALAAAHGDPEVFIIGGAGIYAQSLPFADRLYLTLVHYSFEGDTYFPELEWAQWKEISKEFHEPDERNPYPYSFVVLDRSRRQST